MTGTPPPDLAGLTPLPGHPAAYFGPGASARLGAVLETMAARRVLVVRGHRSFHRSGAARALDGLPGTVEVRHFAGVRVNPSVEQMTAAVRAATEFRADAVVGVGGGSALDVAKVAACLSTRPGEPAGHLRSAGPALPARRCRLVLLPTVSGSGSEVTSFATAYDGDEKLSLDDPAVRADVVLVDPDLTASVPPAVAAASALDALCQAVESYWAVTATAGSRATALRALDVLVPAVAALPAGSLPDDPGLRAALALGSVLAGMSIAATRTTAAHALSYALTGRLGIPHGVAVALHLRWLDAHNAGVSAGDCRHPGGPEAVRGLLADVARSCGGELDRLLVGLLDTAGQPTALGALGLVPAEWERPVARALTSARARNNPRVVQPDHVLANLKG